MTYLDILVDLSVEDYDDDQGQQELDTEGEQGVAKIDNNEKQADDNPRNLFRISSNDTKLGNFEFKSLP